MNIVAATQPWWEDWENIRTLGIGFFWLVIIVAFIVKG